MHSFKNLLKTKDIDKFQVPSPDQVRSKTRLETPS